MKSPCLSILQLTDLHVLPTPESTLLGVKTEHYFWHTLLSNARNTMYCCYLAI